MRDRIYFPLTDLIRAFRELAPTNDRTRQAIVDMLVVGLQPTRGLDRERELEAVAGILPAEPSGEPYLERHIDQWQLPQPPELSPTSSEPPPVPPGEAIPSVLTQIRQASRLKPDWLVFQEQSLNKPTGGEAHALPDPEPLLRPNWTRGILIAALATESEEGPADIEEIIRVIASGEVLRSVPRLPWPTLAQGVQLLIDRSDAMMPFLADVKGITRLIRRVAGDDHLQILRFSYSPLRGAGKGSQRTWTEYRDSYTPLPGTRVICVTDLGIGWPVGSEMPASPEEWLDFADHLQRAGCPLVALVPYGPARWPPALAKRMDIIHWSIRTNAAQVARLVRRRDQPRWRR